MWSQTAWISSGVACAFMTTSITRPRTPSLPAEGAKGNVGAVPTLLRLRRSADLALPHPIPTAELKRTIQ